ncbi:MAG: putative Na+/H+ antiporter [Polaromonas sp.]
MNSEFSDHLLIAGSATGGGMTIIAHAPNPADIAMFAGAFRR